jgi:hypothetical protein
VMCWCVSMRVQMRVQCMGDVQSVPDDGADAGCRWTGDGSSPSGDVVRRREGTPVTPPKIQVTVRYLTYRAAGSRGLGRTIPWARNPLTCVWVVPSLTLLRYYY